MYFNRAPITVLSDDVKSNIIQTNVKGITVKLIHFSIAGLIVTSMKLSDFGKHGAQNQLTIKKHGQIIPLKFPVSENCRF